MYSFKKFIRLTESSLSIPELLKEPNSSVLQNWPDVTDRGEVLYNKIIKGLPIALSSGGEVKLKKDKNILDILKNRRYHELKGKLFTGIDGNMYSLMEFEKTSDFGSSSGVGGGSKATAQFESASAIIAAIYVGEKYKNGTECYNELSKLNKTKLINLFKKYSKNFDVSNTLEDIADFLIGSDDWRMGISYTAEAIKKELKAKSTHVFHRDSKLVSNIINHALNFIRELGYNRMGKDKWNPADIWMFDSGLKGPNKFLKSNSLADANNILLKSLKINHDIDGISLKKVGNAYPPIQYINVEENAHNEIKIDDVNLKVFGRAPLAKDIEILDTDDGIKLQIRDNMKKIGNPVIGELLGKMARAGKIGSGPMFGYIENELKKKIKIYTKDEILDKKGKIINSFINDMFSFFQKLKRNKNIIQDKKVISKIKTIDDVKQLIKDLIKYADENMLTVADVLSSKIQALQFAHYATDDFLSYAYSYAKSNIQGVSGPFIKIGN